MTKLRIQTAAIVYGAMAAFALGCAFYFRDNPNIYHHPSGFLDEPFPLLAGLVLGGGTGIAFGLGVAWLTRYSVYRFAWARNLHMEFRGIFGPLRNTDIVAYALFSAVAEEMLFRGVLQPWLGIALTSLIFGALHIAPGRRFLVWPFQAAIMGFAFGGLYWLSGELSAPVMAHFTINYQNLHFINRYDASLKLPRSFRKG